MTDVAVAAIDDEVATEQRRHLERIEGRTLLDVFRATVDAHRGQPALVVARPDGSFRTRTWGEYEDEASRVAMALRRLGVDHGDVVALMITNRPEHVITDVGILLAGATPVSVYNTLAPDQVAYVAGNCDAKVAIVEDAAVLATWQQVRDQLPNLEHIVVLEAAGVDTSDPSVTTYEQLLTDGARALAGGRGELDNAWRSVSPDDPLTLIYTSGTTGPPKGVVFDPPQPAVPDGGHRGVPRRPAGPAFGVSTCRSPTSPNGWPPTTSPSSTPARCRSCRRSPTCCRPSCRHGRSR